MKKMQSLYLAYQQGVLTEVNDALREELKEAAKLYDPVIEKLHLRKLREQDHDLRLLDMYPLWAGYEFHRNNIEQAPKHPIPGKEVVGVREARRRMRQAATTLRTRWREAFKPAPKQTEGQQ